jgi:integrase
MPVSVSNPRTPKYRHYKPKNLGVVRINGHDEYLGRYNSPESWERYHRLIAEWLANGRQSLPQPVNGADEAPPLSINDVVLTYWQFAKSHYLKDGKPTVTLDSIRVALRPLRQLYGSTPAADFGPKSLKAVRQHLIDAGLSRGVINKRIGQIKRAFKWAVAEELVPASLYHGLQAVAGLTFGRSKARETEPVRPVPDLHVAVVLPFVSPVVAAMVMLQRLSGMRAGEIVIMRPCDIDTSGDIWIYEPSDHKGRWRGHSKQVPLGPEAQRVLQPYLNRDPQAFLFSPPGGRNVASGESSALPRPAAEDQGLSVRAEAPAEAEGDPTQAAETEAAEAGPVRYQLIPQSDRIRHDEGEEGRLRCPALASPPVAAQPRHGGSPEVWYRGRAGVAGPQQGGYDADLRRARHGAGQADCAGDGVDRLGPGYVIE